MVRAVRLRQTTKVTDVLAHRQYPVDVQRVNWIDGIILRTKPGCALLERLGIGRGPPVAQLAVAVGLATLIVKTVTDLMPNHGANRTIIHCIVSIHIEKRWL